MTLPRDKADKLAEKIGEQVHKVWKDNKSDLIKHEVSKEQAEEIVTDGFAKGFEKIGAEQGS